MTFHPRCALPLLVALLAAGCSAEVISPEDPAPPDACHGAGLASAPVLHVTAVTSGAFIGDTLHLQADVDGAPRYLVVRFGTDGAGYAKDAPDTLLGPANLVPVSEGRHARVRLDAAGAAHLDVIDTSDPATPTLLSDVPLGVSVDSPDVFSAADGHVYFCALTDGPVSPLLHGIDAAAAGATPQPVQGFACYQQPEGKLTASGSTWVSWNVPTGAWAQQTRVDAVTPTSDTALVDLGYNQSGVHGYGNVLHASTDGARVVFDAQNKSLFLLADATQGQSNSFNWATFDVESSRSLLGVAGAVAYLVTPSGLRAYDIDDIWNPKLLPYHAEIDFDGEARLVAVSGSSLVVADSGDHLYLVPRPSPGKVTPLVLRAGDPPAEPPPCGG